MLLIFFSFFTGTSLVIGGGRNDEGLTFSSFVLNVHFTPNTNEVRELSYDDLPNFPVKFRWGFGISCEGRYIMGGGYTTQGKYLSNIYELDMEEYHAMPLLNEGRCAPGVCYTQQCLIIGGGFSSSSNKFLDSIEILRISATENSSEWYLSKSKLPMRGSNLTLSSLNGKILLIGGYAPENKSNKVWEGTLDLENYDITWRETQAMQQKRYGHFSVVVGNEIFVFGGTENDKVEIFDGTRWKSGPNVPFPFSRDNAQAVIDRGKRILIISDEYLVVYNTHDGTITKAQNEFKLREKRRNFVAFLQ